jgi:hydrogenase 3 maturation protease
MSWSTELKKFLKNKTRILVLGVGNMQKGDDAAGPQCAERIARQLRKKRQAGVLVINAGGVPENYTGQIRKFLPSHMVIVDACYTGKKAGAISVIDPHSISNGDVSTHRMPLSMLVRFLEETIGGKAMIIGIEPGTIDPNAPLSPAVNRAVEALGGTLEGLIYGD